MISFVKKILNSLQLSVFSRQTDSNNDSPVVSEPLAVSPSADGSSDGNNVIEKQEETVVIARIRQLAETKQSSQIKVDEIASPSVRNDRQTGMTKVGAPHNDASPLLSISQIIDTCRKQGIDLGTGNPQERLRYLVKLGLLPYSVRKTTETSDGIKFEGHFPDWVLYRLRQFDLLIKRGLTLLEIKKQSEQGVIELYSNFQAPSTNFQSNSKESNSKQFENSNIENSLKIVNCELKICDNISPLPVDPSFSDLISTDELILAARQAGVNFGTGNPQERLRYYIKLGLLPHAIRKTIKLPNGKIQVLGYFPSSCVEKLQGIQSLQKQGMTVLQIAEQNRNGKFEALNSKSETNSKFENLKKFRNSEFEIRNSGFTRWRLKPPLRFISAASLAILIVIASAFFALEGQISKRDHSVSKDTTYSMAGTIEKLQEAVFEIQERMQNSEFRGQNLEISKNISPDVLGLTFDTGKFLEINANVAINGNLRFQEASAEGKLYSATLNTGQGDNELYAMNQNVRTTDTVTFAGITSTSLSLGGTALTGSNVVLLDATQTITNKSLSGSSNTFTNIPNSALSNSKVTISAGDGLSGGGDVSLGSSVSLTSTLGTTVSLSSEVTGTLPVGSGGTNLTSYTAGDLIYASAATTLAKLNIGTAGQVLTSVGGVPTWTTVGASGITADSLDFTEFKDAMTLDATTDIATAGFNLTTSGSGAIAFNNTGTFTVAGAATLSSTLGVTGITTLTGNLNANGGLDVDDAFVVADGGGSLTIADNFWAGLGASAGRIEFDDQTTDEVNILGASVGIGTATPGSKLEITGTGSTSSTTALNITDSAGISHLKVFDHGAVNIATGNTAGLDGSYYTVAMGKNATDVNSAQGNIVLSISPTYAETTANGNDFYAIDSSLRVNGAGTVGDVIGGYFGPGYSGSGIVDEIVGTWLYPTLQSSGTATSLYGARIQGGVALGTTSTNYYGVKIDGILNSGTLTNAYGFYVDPLTVGTNNAGVVIGEATGTKNTNLLIGTTTIPTGSYSIYNASTDANYFAGNVGIGTTNPLFKLDVSGTGNITGAVTLGSTLDVTGITTLTGNLNANGGFDVDDVFVVADGGVLTANTDADFVFAGNENMTITNTTNTLGGSGMLDLASTSSTTDTRTLDLSTTFSSTGATTSYGLYNAWASSAVVTGAGVSQTAYGSYTTATKTGADDATGTYTLYGAYSTASNTGRTAAGTVNTYGGYFSATGDTSGTTKAIGLYATASGADNNYAAIFESGNVGIGTTSPGANLDITSTVTSGTGLRVSSSTVTNGTLLSLVHTTTAATGNLFNISAAATLQAGNLAHITATDGALRNSAGNGLFIQLGNSIVGTGLKVTTSGATGLYGVGNLVNLTSNMGGSGNILYISGNMSDESTDAVKLAITHTSDATGGTSGNGINVSMTANNASVGITSTGIRSAVTDTNVVGTAITHENYGGYFTATKTGASTDGTFNTYGIYTSATGSSQGTSTAIGLYTTATGADANYAAIFASGNVGIGTTAPGAALAVGVADVTNFSITSAGITSMASYLQVGSTTSTTYSRFGTGTTGHSLSGAEDVLVSGDLEVDGTSYFDGNVGIGSTLTLTGHLLPGADDTYDIGTAALRWRDLYLGPTTMHIVSTIAETVTARDWEFRIDETDSATSEGSLFISEGANNYLAINTSGNVGIGTTAPAYKTDILTSTASDRALNALNSATSGTNYGIYGKSNGAGATANYGVYADASGATSNYALYSDNGSGGHGAFSSTTALTNGYYHTAGVSANGYIYMLGGADGANNGTTNIYYAKVKSDGTVGSWTAASMPTALADHAVTVANGYVYVIGGSSTTTGSGSTTVYYAKINSDGSLGSWSTNSNSLPAARYAARAVNYNGYIYVVGGSTAYNQAPATTVYYAKINADGSTGAWTANSNVLNTARYGHTSVIANGYIYALSGSTTSGYGTLTATVEYAKINSDGTVGTWATTTALTAAVTGSSAQVINGYIYVMGGDSTGSGGNVTTVYYGKVGSAGTIASWTTSANTIAGGRFAASATYNGYLYYYGGYTATVDTAVYHSSTTRSVLANSLDLVGATSGITLNEGGAAGGSLTAGNTFVSGNLEVTQNANLWNGLSVNGATSLFSSATTGPVLNLSATSLTSGAALAVTGGSGYSATFMGGNVGIGTTAPNNALEILSTTTPQLRVAYDTSNYMTAAVSNAGAVTFDTNGTGAAFAFSDGVTASSTLTSTGTFTANGIANIGDGGDAITLNGTTVDIDATGALQINSSGGAISIGNDAVAQNISIGTGGAARTITLGNNTTTSALAFTSGTGAQTFTSSVATTGTTSSAFVFNASALSSGTGLYITSTATSGKLIDINATNTSGTIFNLAYGAQKTLDGALTGFSIDLNSGNVIATNQDVTGVNFKIPTVTNTHTSGTKTLTGLLVNFGSGAGINQSGAGGTLEYVAGDFQLPALTQTAGTLNAYGLKVTTPSSITTGGTAYGNYISATGVGAGTLYGVGISNITGSGGTEYAFNVAGTGWDAVLRVGSTTVINGSGVTQVAGGGTGLASYAIGDLIYASAETTLAKRAIGNTGEVLVVSGGVPTWSTITGSSCTNCLVNNPTATQTITPNVNDITGLSVRKSSNGTPTADIFSVASNDGATKYFYVDKDGNVSTGAISNTTLTLTPTTNTTALTLVGTNVTSAKNQYINTKNSSGTILDLSYGAAQTLAGSLIASNIDLSTNLTATNQSATGSIITLPGVTNTITSGTKAYTGISILAGGGVNQNGTGGTTNFIGADITIPALTQTLGTLNAYGVQVTTPSSMTTGGTAAGVYVNPTGVGAGTLYGVNIGAITGGSGTEYGLAIGSGWDRNLYFNDTSTNVLLADGGVITITDGTNTLCTITDSGSAGNLDCSGNITASGGTVGGWTRTGTTLSPATANDIVSISTNAATGAALSLTNSAITTSGSSGFANTTTVSSTGAAATFYGLNNTVTNSNSTNANTVYGTYTPVTDSTALANTIVGSYASLALSGNAAKIAQGVRGQISSSSTTADTLYSGFFDSSITGIIGSGTRNVYSVYSAPSNTAANTAGTLNMYGGYFTPSSTGPTTGTTATTNVYGSYITSTATHAADAGTVNQYGLYVANGTSSTNGTSTKYGIYVESPTGADTNYSIYSAGGANYLAGNIGIGDTTPTEGNLTLANGAGYEIWGSGTGASFNISSDADMYLLAQSGKTLRFGSNGVNDHMVINAGNVGIGTTAPGQALEVTGNIQISSGADRTIYGPAANELNINAGGTSPLDLNNSSGGNVRLFVDHGSGSPFELQIFDYAAASNDYLKISHSGTTAGIDTSSTADFLTLQSGGGSVGIGDISPDALFDIDSSATTTNVVGITSTTLTTGEILDITGTWSPTDGSTNDAIDINITNSPSTLANGLRSIELTTTDATALANTVYGVHNTISLTGDAAKGAAAFYGTVTSSSTTADTLYGGQLTTSATGAIASGTRNIYGLELTPASTGANSAGTTNLYGGYFNPSLTGPAAANTHTANVYGSYITSTATHAADAGTINQYGLYVANGTSSTNGTSTKYGIYVESPTGADTNYSIYSAGGVNTFAGCLNLGSSTDCTSSTTGRLALSNDSVFSGSPASGKYINMSGTSTVAGNLMGVSFAPTVNATSTDFRAFYSRPTVATGVTVTSGYGMYIANPALAGTGAITTNYGIYLEDQTSGGTDYSIYSNGGTNYFSGNVGIGTTAPVSGAKLQAVGTIYNSASGGFAIGGDIASVNRIDTFGADSQPFRFLNTVNGYAGIRISDLSVGANYGGTSSPASGAIIEGNVGIGTTAPGAKLDVGPMGGAQSATAGSLGLIRNNAAADSSPYTQARLIVYGGASVDTGNWAYFGYGADAQLRQVYSKTSSAATMLWGTTSAMDGTGAFTQTMSLTAGGNLTNIGTLTVQGTGNSSIAGNVGIGTAAPGSLLDIDMADASSITAEKITFRSAATTQTLTDGTTIASWYANQLIAPTLNGVAAGGTETVTAAATLYVDGAPSGSNITISNAYSIFSDAGLVRFDRDSIGTTATDGLFLMNNTDAAAGAQQYSPALRLRGEGWKTDATAASQNVDWRQYVVPVQGTANPTSYLSFESSVNDAAFANVMALTSGGNVGIGTTNPLQKLMVSGDTQKIGLDLVGNTAGYSSYVIYEAGVEKASIQYIGSTFATADRRGAMELIGQGKIDFHSDGYSATPDLRITGGNVGIGTTAPGAKFTLSNNVATGFLDNYSEYQQMLFDGTTAGTSYGFGIKDNTMVFNSGAGAYSFDRAGNATTMTLDISGNVGIGTTAPNNALEVLSTTTPQLRVAYNTSNYATAAVSSAGAVTFDATGASAGFTFSDSTSVTGSLTASTSVITPTVTTNSGDLTLDAAGKVIVADSEIELTETGATFTLDALRTAGDKTVSLTNSNGTYVANLDVEGQVRIGRFTSAPTSIGEGALYYNTTDSQLYIANAGGTWSPLGTNGTQVLLTNKSGGTVTQYSIVIEDTANDNSFTTTTTAYNKKVIGIMTAASCASDASCLVTIGGKSTVVTKNAVTKGDYIYTSDTAGQAVASAKQFDGLLGVAMTSDASAPYQVDVIFIPQLQVTASAAIDKGLAHTVYRQLADSYSGTSLAKLYEKYQNVSKSTSFDTFIDQTKVDTTTTVPVDQYKGRVGLYGGRTLNNTNTDTASNSYLGSNDANDVYFYDRSQTGKQGQDSTPEVLADLGIDPNWYNGVTLITDCNGSNCTKKTNLSTTYNGGLVKVDNTYTTDDGYIDVEITAVSTTGVTFNWDTSGATYSGDQDDTANFNESTDLIDDSGATDTNLNITFQKADYKVGDRFRIASWYVEPAAANDRGGKQQFPERSYIVASADNVDIIDADTNKLWLRFGTTAGQYTLIGAASGDFNAVQMLNGSVYTSGGSTGTSAVSFVKDSGVLYQSGGAYISTNHIGNRNTTGEYSGTANSSFALVNTITNDVSAAVVPNHSTKEVTVSGWGYIVGDSTAAIEETVYLPYKFNDYPRINVTVGGYKTGSVPTNLNDCGSTAFNVSSGTQAYTVTQNSFSAQLQLDAGNTFNSSYYYCYTWTATGEVSPKQMVAVASGGASNDGGVNVINESDHSSVKLIDHTLAGAGCAAVDCYNSDVVLTSKGDLYAVETFSAGSANLGAYYRVGGVTANQSTWGQYRHAYHYVQQSSQSDGSGIAILGSATTDYIDAIYVTENTSTIAPNSNTVYIATDGGVTVLQEKQTGISERDATAVPQDHSVKYYTKDYISEEMVSDIRGMWPLNADNTTSDLEDISVKANVLTATNIDSNDAVSGVRGKATDFDGSTEYLSCTDASCGGTSDLDPTTVTISAWVKPDVVNANMMIAGKNGSVAGDDSYMIWLTNNPTFQFLISLDGTNSTSVNAKTVPVAGQWAHITGTYDGTTAKVYVNGKLEGSTAVSGTLFNPTSIFTIGADAQQNLDFDGTIDEVMVTSEVLDDSQIRKIYEVGKRALEGSHATNDFKNNLSAAGTAAGGTNIAKAVGVDTNNKYMYVGMDGSGADDGWVSKVDLNSDAQVDQYTTSTSPAIADNDVTSLSVGANLEIVGNDGIGAKQMAIDGNGDAATGNFVGKTVTTPVNFTQAYMWVNSYVDSSDTTSAITVKASNDGGSNYVTGTLTNTDTNQSPSEKEYFFQFSSPGSSLKVKFEFARDATKMPPIYVTKYGVNWIGSDVVGGAAGGNGLYTNTDSALANGSALTVTHNGNSNDILSNAWINENGLWRQIDSLGGINHTSSDTGIRGWWKLDETSSTAADSSGNSQTLTNNGSLTYSQMSPMSTGIKFDGSTAYFSCTDANCGGTTELDSGTNSWSYGAWFKTSTTGATQTIINKGDNSGASSRYFIRVTSANVLQGSMADGTNEVNLTGSTVVTDNQWHYVIVTEDGTNLKIYLDGKLETSTSSTSLGSSDNAIAFEVGRGRNATTPDFYFNGSIDEPFVQAAALSADQVLQLYRLGISKDKFLVQQTSANAVALYNYTGAATNVRLDVITGGLGRNAGTVSLHAAAADVDSQSSGSSIWVNKTGSGGNLIELEASGTDMFTVSSAGAGYFAGNVGIGTTAPNSLVEMSASNNGAATSLRITNSYSATSSTDEYADLDFYQGTAGGYYTSGRIRSFREGDYLSSNTQITGGLSFWTQTSNATPANGWTEKMRITAAGNVGIGTTSPATILDIDTGSNTLGLRLRGLAETTEISDLYVDGDGALVISNTAGADTAQYIDIRTEDNEYGLILRNSTGSNITTYSNLYMNDAATDYLNIVVNATNATTGLVIDDNDRVGVGTTAPDHNFDVEATTNVNLSEFHIKFGEGSTGSVITTRNQRAASSAYQFFYGISDSDGTPDSEFLLRGDGIGYSDGGWTTPAADYAEYFLSDYNLEPGDLVSVDPASSNSVMPASKDAKSLVGVISTLPGFIGNSGADGDYENNPRYKVVGLVGQLPIKVSSKNGFIQKGDLLTYSEIDGVAVKALGPGQIIGKALEDYDGSVQLSDEVKKKEAERVKTSDIYKPVPAPKSGIGKIMVYLNIGYADPNNMLANMSLDDKGYLIAPKFEAGEMRIEGIDTDKLAVNAQSIDPSLLTAFGDLVSCSSPLRSNDILDKNYYPSSECNESRSVDLASTINAIIDVDAKQTEKILALEEMTASNSAMLADQGKILKQVQDDSKEQESRVNALVEEVATRSSTLADAVSTTSSKISSLSDQINELMSSWLTQDPAATDSGVLAAARPQNDSTLALEDPSLMIASDSAQLAKLDISEKLTAMDLSSITATVSDTFKVYGESFLSNTSIFGDLVVDGTMTLADNSINVIGTPVTSCQNSVASSQSSDSLKSDSVSGLSTEVCTNGILYIQNSPLAYGVDFFNGLVKIDNKGTIFAESIHVAEIKLVSGKTSGSGVIRAGLKTTTMEALNISKTSRVLITPTTPTNFVLAVTDKIEATSSGSLGRFVVSSPVNASSDIEFDWLVINESDPLVGVISNF